MVIHQKPAIQPSSKFQGFNVAVSFRYWAQQKIMTHHSKTRRSKPNSHSCRESNLATKLLYANMIGLGISVIKNNLSLQPLLNSLEMAMDERGERFDG